MGVSPRVTYNHFNTWAYAHPTDFFIYSAWAYAHPTTTTTRILIRENKKFSLK
ncbi:hypothetical protein NTHI1209_01336 [Haemophilus influenzae]|uniref:Uncharacterized protein n=1 Tax=Haemophilus influenzae TaxID=727 RepID=A0A158SXY4_HAEIF|nr:hypothetical protein NTHI1209_01336 [Haemophilus influenzae]